LEQNGLDDEYDVMREDIMGKHQCGDTMSSVAFIRLTSELIPWFQRIGSKGRAIDEFEYEEYACGILIDHFMRDYEKMRSELKGENMVVFCQILSNMFDALQNSLPEDK
jgi:hypothetical protein